MKRITAVLLVLLLTLALTACGTQEKTETIYVQIRSVRTIGEQVIRSEFTYSPKGTPVSVKTYFNDVLYQTASTRTSGGVSYMTVIDKDGNEVTQNTTTVYDDRGNVTRVDINVGTTTVSRTTYTYDDQDRVLKAESLTAQGTSTISYTYDAKGNMAEQIKDDGVEENYARTVYTYDDRGYVLEEKSYNKENVLQGGITYTYAANDTERTAAAFDGNGEATGEVVASKYDANGYLIEETTSMNGEVVQTIVNTYEAMEVPVKE